MSRSFILGFKALRNSSVQALVCEIQGHGLLAAWFSGCFLTMLGRC